MIHRIVATDLPHDVRAVAAENTDGSFTIYLSDTLSAAERRTIIDGFCEGRWRV